MSKSWEIVNILKAKGPMTANGIWSHVQPLNLFRSKNNFKDTLHFLKQANRVQCTQLTDNLTNTKSFLFTITKRNSNFITKEQALDNREKFSQYGKDLKSWFAEITTAENTLRDQYHATRPAEKATYDNKMKILTRQREAYKKRGERARKAREAQKKKQEEAKLKKEAEKEQKAKSQFPLPLSATPSTPDTPITSTPTPAPTPTPTSSKAAQLTLAQRRVAAEMRRINTLRKQIAARQRIIIKKGQHKATIVRTVAAERANAGPLGAPARDALEARKKEEIIQRAQRLREAKARAKERDNKKQLALAAARKAKADALIKNRTTEVVVMNAPPPETLKAQKPQRKNQNKKENKNAPKQKTKSSA